MLGNQKTTTVALLGPGDKANTSAATGSWVQVTNYEGVILVTQNVGAVTAGTIDGKLQHATSNGGAGAADITGATFTRVSTSNDPAIETIAINTNGLYDYIRYVGTIGTGPAQVGVSFTGCPKY